MYFRNKRTNLATVAVICLSLLVLGSLSLSVLAGSEGDIEKYWGPYLTINGKLETVVNWKSDRKGAGDVSFARASYFARKEKTRESIRENEDVLFHHVPLTGLVPGTEYVYRVESVPGAVETNYFGSLEKDPKGFSFFVYGDTRTCPRRHRLVASEMALDPMDPAFVLHTGDLVESPVSPNWADFFWAIEPFSKSTPLLPVLGNHERNDDSYYKAFSLPTGGGDYDEEWYSFEYGDVNFVVLDSNADQIGLANFMDQRSWLKNELKNQTEQFTVVLFHHPIYSSEYSTGADSGLADSWGSLFEEYGVDLVFNGHVHSYERIVKNGVTYVVTGGGGAPTGKMKSRFDFSERARGDSLHYVRVSVKEKELVLETIEVARVDREAGAGRVGCNVNLKVNKSVIDRTVIELD